MTAVRKLTRLTPPGVHAIHFYYDVCPESPDGRRVVYVAFDRPPEVPLVDVPGTVCVVEVATGMTRQVARLEHAERHAGARQLWVDDDTIAFCDGAPGSLRTVLVSLTDGTQREMAGALRMLSPTAPVGLTTSHDYDPPARHLDDTVCRMELTAGRLTPLFTLEQAMRLHPLGVSFPGSEHLAFMHTKWAPDGARFFVMASNTSPLTRLQQPGEGVHAVFVADADGGNLRYAGEEAHHPMWGVDPRSGRPIICTFVNRPDRGQDLTAFDPDTGARWTLIERMLGKHACVNHDGTRIVVDLTNWPHKPLGAVVAYDVAHQDFQVLAQVSQPDYSNRACHLHPTWSRDGQRAYFNTSTPGERSLWVVDAGPQDGAPATVPPLAAPRTADSIA